MNCINRYRIIEIFTALERSKLRNYCQTKRCLNCKEMVTKSIFGTGIKVLNDELHNQAQNDINQ